jgi:hypothetical protein
MFCKTAQLRDEMLKQIKYQLQMIALIHVAAGMFFH